MNPKPVMLHIEDDDATAYLFAQTLRVHHADLDVFRLCNGDDALFFLTRTGPFADAPRPDVLVLNLQILRKNGYDVLAELRHYADLQHTPVIIFSAATQLRGPEPAGGWRANKQTNKCADVGFAAAAREVLKHIREAASTVIGGQERYGNSGASAF